MGIDQVYPCCWIGDAFDLEEEAQQSAAVLAVQREMEDADELNYLDEEGTFTSVSWKLLDCYSFGTFRGEDRKSEYFNC